MASYSTPVLIEESPGEDDDLSEVGPLIVIGAVFLALMIARLGSSAAVARWSCGSRGVYSWNNTWWGGLNVRCR